MRVLPSCLSYPSNRVKQSSVSPGFHPGARLPYPVHTGISNIRWQIALRIVSVLLLVCGAAMITWDLVTSFQFLEQSTPGSSHGIAAAGHFRLVSLASFIIGGAFLALSFIFQKSE